MPTPNPMTVDQLVNSLIRSQTPKIVVEGGDDMKIYRKLLTSSEASFVWLPAGGREKLLQIYERRSEFAHVPVAFIADQDMWLFSGIPEKYADIIWTQGYSIENDLYVSGDLETLLETHQTETHRQVLEAVCTWFAYEVEAFLDERPSYVAASLDEMIPRGKTELDEEFCKRRGFVQPPEERYQQIRRAYQLQVRGKLLFQILVRSLNTADRDFRFQTTHHGLFAIALDRPVSRQLFDRLIQAVQEKLDEQTRQLAAQQSASDKFVNAKT